VIPRRAARLTSRRSPSDTGATPPQYNLACAAAQLGDDDEALRRLEMAQAAGMDIGQIAPGDDDLEALRHNPRFRELTRGWRHDAEREKKHKHDKQKS
jgi:hypothetical protein